MTTNQTIPLNRIKPHPDNYNTHPDRQIETLRESLRQFGQVRSVVVQAPAQDNGYYLCVAGHGLTQAAEEEGFVEVRADVLPADWPPHKVKAYLVADNETQKGSDPDLAQLDALIKEIGDIDAELLKAMAVDVDALLAAMSPEHGDGDAEPQISRADELQEAWGVELGQLWQIGEHRLICGDCTDESVVERVMGGEKADMMFTDPPYGVGYTGGHFHSGDVNIKREREDLANDDNAEIYSEFLPVVLPFVNGACYMWFADSKARDVYNAVFDANCEIHALIIWHKTNATYAAMNAQYKQRHEPCLYFKPKGSTLRWCGATTESTLWEIKRDGVNEFHPTQKPIELATKAIGNHAADLILDAFAGSGSTLVACQNLNRRCRAVEISPAYCAVILERMATAFPELDIYKVE